MNNVKLIFPDKSESYVEVGSDLSGISSDGERPIKAIINNLEISDVVDANKKCDWICYHLINALK